MQTDLEEEGRFAPKHCLIRHTDEIKCTNKSYTLILRAPFINETIKKKIAAGVVKEIMGTKETLKLYANLNVIKTQINNPKLAWSNYCALKFPKQPKNIISIIGTNGKTSTCSYISQILTKINIPNIFIGTTGIYENGKKTMNNENSTPDASVIHYQLNNFAKKHPEGFGIIETTSIGIEEYRVHNIHPQVSIFTNLTKDHIDYHRSMQNYLNAKLKLGTYADKFFVHNSIQQTKYPQYGNELISAETTSTGSKFNYKIDNKSYSLSVKLMGEFNAQNVLAAIMALKEYFPIDSFIRTIEEIEPAEGRLNKYENIIIDYAHTLDGVRNIFQTVRDFKPNKIIVVIGFGGYSDPTRLTEISSYLNENANMVILTIDNPRDQDPMEIALKSKEFCPKAEIELDREKAIRKAYDIATKDDIILLLGKGHEPYMDIKGVKNPYSDKENVIKILKEKHKKLA